MADNRLIKGLKRIVGKEYVLTRPAQLQVYEYDASLDRHLPDVVVLPACTEEVAAIARLTHQLGVPIVPRGAGTSLSGGPIPARGGVVVVLSRMDRILDIDIPNRRAVVQPGVYNLDLQNALSDYGYFFAPDPASQSVSTLGGNVAENSGGPHCLKYGVTTNHVTGLEVVLPDGEIVRLGGWNLPSPGYDLTGLFTGSEGTFGIATEVTCRIMRKPEAALTMLAIFDAIPDAAEAVSAIIAHGILPATLEMMDNVIIKAVEQSMHAGYPLDADAVLIIELDGLADGMERQAARIREICAENGAREVRIATDSKDREHLWAGRRGAAGAVARLAPSKIVTDVTVPRTNLPDMLRRVMEISTRYRLLIGNLAHAGDGNLHPEILFDPRDEDEVERVRQADHAIAEAAVALGGTITGEHGVGMQKIKDMNLLLSPSDARAQMLVKEVFDPDGLCNPGKVLPDVPSSETMPAAASVTTDLPTALAQTVGEENVTDRGRRAIVVEPNTYEATADVLALAREHKARVRICGNAAAAPEDVSADIVLSTARLSGIVEQDAGNLTVTVQAGTLWRDMQSALAQAGQWVPLDAPGGDRRATVGQVVAENGSGPRRLRYGEARDLVLGMKVALATGELVQCGGKTVKNVSGYDITKLFIGSLGTLGAITEVTFRTVPLPEAAQTLLFTCTEPQQAARFARAVTESQLLPSALEFINADAAERIYTRSRASLPHDAGLVLTDFEGVTEAVERQSRDVADAALGAGLIGPVALNGEERIRLLQAVTDIAGGDPEGRLPAAWRICCPISRVADIVALCDGLGNDANSPAAVVAGLETGVMHLVAEEARVENAVETAVAPAVAQWGGTMTALTAERELRLVTPPPDGLHLMRRLKARFDPAEVLPTAFLSSPEPIASGSTRH